MNEIVIPGEALEHESESTKAGMNTNVDNKTIYAQKLGVKDVRGSYINILPIGEIYKPRSGDVVIGSIKETEPSLWVVNINTSNPGILHVSEVPWSVEFGETARYLRIGDSVIVKIHSADAKIQLSMRDKPTRKINGGYILDIMPNKVPVIIGKEGSMISILKKYSNCRIFVGQNGRVWIEGEHPDIMKVIAAIRKIESELNSVNMISEIENFFEADEAAKNECE